MGFMDLGMWKVAACVFSLIIILEILGYASSSVFEVDLIGVNCSKEVNSVLNWISNTFDRA